MRSTAIQPKTNEIGPMGLSFALKNGGARPGCCGFEA
jgi:hypothetical protein